ncbi:MAG TPA: YkgJ family cysteine cluster protein [Gaiellaceae bacterium]|nr:YkgJ family cysteine cluster protein [Gaiellaceae bacterium]
MSQDERRAKRAGKVVLQLYRERETFVADAAKRMGVMCSEGCAHCCMMPATATVPEMVPVVQHLASRPDWDKQRPALEKKLARQLAEFEGVNVLDENERVAFFRRQLPCAFLTPQKRCGIYAVRPTVCRYHMVVSAPENCAHGAQDENVVMVDLSKLEREVAVEAAREFGELTGGPLALAFVLAAKLLGVKLDVDPGLLRRVAKVRVRMPA